MDPFRNDEGMSHAKRLLQSSTLWRRIVDKVSHGTPITSIIRPFRNVLHLQECSLRHKKQHAPCTTHSPSERRAILEGHHFHPGQCQRTVTSTSSAPGHGHIHPLASATARIRRRETSQFRLRGFTSKVTSRISNAKADSIASSNFFFS